MLILINITPKNIYGDGLMKKNIKKLPIKILKLEGVKIEKLFLVIFIICFLALLIAQALMTNLNIRSILTQEEKVEGVFLGKSDQLFSKGIMTLDLVNCENADNVWVLVNGERTESFYKKQISISVRDSDLVEIDGTESDEPVKLKVDSCSKNVRLTIDNSVLEINKNIAVLARTKVK